MEQVQSDRIRAQGGVDAIKEVLDQVIQEKMNLKGQVYFLTFENQELKQKLQIFENEKNTQKSPEVAVA